MTGKERKYWTCHMGIKYNQYIFLIDLTNHDLGILSIKNSEPTKQCVDNKIDTLNNDKIHVGTIKIHTFYSQKQIGHNYS